MTEVAKPAELAGPRRRLVPGVRRARRVTAEIHVGVEEPFAPARKAHPALLLPRRRGRARGGRGPAGRSASRSTGASGTRSRASAVPHLRRARQPGRAARLTWPGRRSNRNRPVDSTLSLRGPSLEPVVFLGGSGAGVTQVDAPTSTGATPVVNRIKPRGAAVGRAPHAGGGSRPPGDRRPAQGGHASARPRRLRDRRDRAARSARKGAVSEDELDQLERFFLSLA